MRRYKYLEKLLEEEMKKVLVYIKGFSEPERVKLARMTALWISNGSVPPAVLNSLINASPGDIFNNFLQTLISKTVIIGTSGQRWIGP